MRDRLKAGVTIVAILSFFAIVIDASDNYTVNHGANTNITAHTVCSKVTNNSTTSASVYVPTQTSLEWQSFRTNPPAGVTLGACQMMYVGGVDGGGLANGVTTFSATDILISGNYAYVLYYGVATACSSSASNSNGCELKIFDISDPDRPVYVGGGDSSGRANSGTGAIMGTGLAITGNYLYTTWGYNATACSSAVGAGLGCELKVWNVSNPAAPAYVFGSDSSAVSGGTNEFEFNDVAISGSYAYTVGDGSSVACGTASASRVGCELKVWNISNPAAPTFAAGIDSTGTRNGGTTANPGFKIVAQGNYVYTLWDSSVTTCSRSAGAGIGCEFKIFSIATPTSISYVGGGDSGGGTNTGTDSADPKAIYVSGNYAYTMWEEWVAGCGLGATNSGENCELKIWNIASPTAPDYVVGGDATGRTNSGDGEEDGTAVVVDGNYVYAGFGSNTTGCSRTVGSGIGCEIKAWRFTAPTSLAYIGGADGSGSLNSGAGSMSFGSFAISNGYLYTVGGGTATACSNSVGAAAGCELKIWSIGQPPF
jgi:hypothetical protein